MSTVKELKEWLNNFPEETIVKIIGEKGTYEPLDMPDNPLEESNIITYGNTWEYMDFSKNEFVKPDAPWFGKKFLNLGCITF